MDYKPHFSRVLVKRVKKEVNEWDKKPEVNSEIAELLAIGETCEPFLKELIGKEVLISGIGTKIQDETDFETFLIPQEAILMS